MSAGIRVAVDIAAEPSAVWRAVEDVRSHVEWMGDAEAIRFTTEETRGVGVEFECDTRVGPFTTVDVMSITEWEPGHAMGISHRGAVTGEGRFLLEPLPTGGTRFVWEETLALPRRLGGSLGARLVGPVLAAVWRRNLRRLRRIVESGWT